MAGLTPIPTSRVSDYLVRMRLMTQLQTDQLDLFRIQEQVSTGRRISLPSEDAPAALRAITLQRLIERKEQVQVNLTTNQSYLAVSDAALNTVSGILADIRGSALAVAGTTSTNEQRAAVAQQVDRAIQQLVDIGNQSFRGRYLFAGSRSGVQPYDYIRDYVVYSGNERELRSYSDLDVLFETNISGNQVFGAISESVQGTIDLNPHITGDTRLSSLRDGLGISPNGAILVSDGSNTSIVDLSNASTVADVAALIEANPPAGRTVRVDLTDNGFAISLEGGGILTITEVAGGTAAKELGIFNETGVLPPTALIGSDLKPAIELTTPLDNLLGTKAKTTFQIDGPNNDLLIEATENGEAYHVDIVFTTGAVAGSEVVTYTPGIPTGTLEIQIEDGVSTAEQIAEAIRAEGHFHARIDDRDADLPTLAGTGTVDVLPINTTRTAGGGGSTLDRSGIMITNVDQTFAIDLTDTETVEDLLNAINGAGAGVLAEINATADGIDIRSRVSGADFSIGENGGASATQLGVRTFLETTRLEDLNFGIGIPTVTGTDFTIIRNDGTELDIDATGAETVGDLLDLINNHADNLVPRLRAELAEFGNGIELIDDQVPPNALTVRAENLSRAAEYLGLVDPGATEQTATSSGVDPVVLTGRDVHPYTTESVFNTLIRLKKGLEANDIVQIQSAIAEMDEDITRVTFGRSEVGARQQSLEVLQTRLEDEVVELKSALSLEIDADLTEAISNMTARRVALEASLRTAATLLQISLLNYI